ncbi:MAG: DUF3862 domain-containing protein [Clostridia bacterium]|nr:DUF3862 domain-containing protein [Clostridia bacterium]
MAMKTCKDCGTEISKSAKICPKCGKKLKHTGLRVFFGILVIIALVVISNSGNNTNITDDTNSKTQTTAKSAVTKENYDKIKEGMTEQEVKEILGEPSSVSENEISGLGKTELKHYQEAFSLKAIDVYFNNGKVSMKNWTDL